MIVGQVHEYWNELLTTALLGCDRREPPTPAGAFAHLAVESGGIDQPSRFAQQVAACTVALRAGVTPLPAVGTPPSPAPDRRPPTSLQVGATWRQIISEWPTLEDEWLRVLAASGRRLSPELVPVLLERHRAHPWRHRLVCDAAGSLAQWMIEWSPRLASSGRAALEPPPPLPVTPELELLCGGPGAAVHEAAAHEEAGQDGVGRAEGVHAEQVVAAVVDGLRSGRYAAAHRGVLVNLVCRLPRPVLAVLAAALHRAADEVGAFAVARQLAVLADLRQRMLDELEPIP